ncbi:putative universal stress protein [Rosellinia necatrix]|uniref:Putative universal stress protein n=1 Tax=Rosellinia necatrix TaxID=77044 RepID=A0A1W2TET1_ROSNE|nr:putative universal stress protein [Rosellinia necatrix]
MSGDELKPVVSPESDASPTSQPITKGDYFSLAKRRAPTTDDDAERSLRTPRAHAKNPVSFDLGSRGRDMDNTGDASATTPGETASSSGSSAPNSRKGSLGNVTFRAPQNPSLPQGLKKPHSSRRIREASPPYRKFESHVAFDNIPLGDPTPYNLTSFTLNVRHAGFQFKRRHRTFMVGVDDNSYSDHALQWLLDELVDDGDEIVCVRVIETQVRLTDNTYQDDAKALMEKIQTKNTQNRAISLILEYAVGKLHNTFQHLIKIYQPSMLIVGTKGRSMDGVHGFLVNRSSFSKYCLQYSPVPVVVVRPTEMREKKKAKRAGDPSRQSYIHILGNQKHEADSENSSAYELEPTLTPDEEAHRVAVAVGLPAAYDPTIKPLDPANLLRRPNHQPPKSRTKIIMSVEKKLGDESESEEEEEFEVSLGADLLKKEKLHKMELNEGAALRAETSKSSTGSLDSDEDPPGGGGAKT